MEWILRIPRWILLVLAAAFIIFRAVTCHAFDRSADFWNKKPCGFKEVELDKGAVPEEIWKCVNQLVSKCESKGQDGFSSNRVDKRNFSYAVKSYPMTSGYRVRSILIRRGGEVIYYGGEKVCPQ